MTTKAIVTDPIGEDNLKREGDFDKLWAEMGEEFKGVLLALDGIDSWVNLNATIDGESYQFNRTIALDN